MSDLLACREWVESRVCQYSVQRAQNLIPEPAGKKNVAWHAPFSYQI